MRSGPGRKRYATSFYVACCLLRPGFAGHAGFARGRRFAPALRECVRVVSLSWAISEHSLSADRQLDAYAAERIW